MPNRIRAHRLAQVPKMTLEDLAFKVGCSPIMISQLERGTRRMSQHWMDRIAPHLGVSPGDLLPPDANRSAEDMELDRFRELIASATPEQRSAILHVAETMIGYAPQPAQGSKRRAG